MSGRDLFAGEIEIEDEHPKVSSAWSRMYDSAREINRRTLFSAHTTDAERTEAARPFEGRSAVFEATRRCWGRS
jgi:hypothetical protein